ncbi:hypothetical protein N7448_011019 [Penicillium atrosanguineum]|nr:hypothetical protein N7448_011019 [Penicillium atrosanguineum]
MRIVTQPRYPYFLTAIDPLAFRDYIGERQLSVIFLTTSLFNATALACPTAFQGVREVLMAGEVASPLAMQTTTFSKIQLVTLKEAQREKIGINNNSLPITTNNKPKELFISGLGISPGYIGRPEETTS